MKGMPASDTDSRMMVFAGNANPKLARDIVGQLRLHLGNAHVKCFSDGEVQVEIMENVRGKDVFIVQPTCAPTNDNLMELLVMIDALRRSSAARITAVIPYFGYARQDRRPRAARVPITAKVVAQMIGTVKPEKELVQLFESSSAPHGKGEDLEEPLAVDWSAGIDAGALQIGVEDQLQQPCFVERAGDFAVGRQRLRPPALKQLSFLDGAFPLLLPVVNTLLQTDRLCAARLQRALQRVSQQPIAGAQQHHRNQDPQ